MKSLNTFCNLGTSFFIVLSFFIAPKSLAIVTQDEMPKLENPMSVQYLQRNILKKSPRIVLTPKLEKNLKKDLKSDPVIQNMYKALQLNATAIQKEPLLERVMVGRRLLHTSREMLYRMNTLCMVYRMDKDATLLNRINDEVIAVCNFTDWNPSHFLDVAEMALAVAIAVDWAGNDLPPATVALAKKALIEKGIQPSYNEKGMYWVTGANNWNQVCHAGMIAAAIVISGDDPALASKTISRALDGLPYAMIAYGPDGVYPEGSTYWGYGTGFTVMASAMLESAFGTDFGLGNYPGYRESSVFRVLANAPSGWYYNFADCGDRRLPNGDIILAWFAAKTGNPVFFERERFLRPIEEMGELSRLAGSGLVWLSQYEEKEGTALPSSWKGDGANPVVFFTGGAHDQHQYYFGGKGGRGTVNHGNMDGGSFVFELNGVRWVVDPGIQGYHQLEKEGFDLWGTCQECERWTLLTKNNYGHSTLTVNDQLHVVNGLATIVDFKAGETPEATIDMNPTFEGQLKSASRKFVKDSPVSLLIEDHFELDEETKLIAWQLMTTADVEVIEGGAILKKDGKQLKIENLNHPELRVSVISLDPPPLALDRKIEGLKRIEIRMPAYLFEEGVGTLKVRLSGE